MKLCPSCKSENPDSARFCRKCGTPIDVVSEQKPDSILDSSTLTAEAASVNFSTSGSDSSLIFTPAGSGTLQQTINDPTTAEPATASENPAPTAAASGSNSAPRVVPAVSATAGVPGVTPTSNQMQTIANTQAKLFMRWLLSALKKPSLRAIKPAWWAFVPMLGNAMIVALLGYVWASQALHGVSSAVNSFTSRLGVSSGVGDPSIGIGVFFRGWIAVALVLYAMVAVVFIGKKIYGDTVDIQEVHDKLSQIMIAFAALNIVLLLLTLIGASMMAGVIFMISLIFMLFIPSYLISVSTNRRQLDSFWLWAISMVVAAVVFFMILFLAINIAGSQFAQALISMMG